MKQNHHTREYDDSIPRVVGKTCKLFNARVPYAIGADLTDDDGNLNSTRLLGVPEPATANGFGCYIIAAP
jgi:hypothetical protein